MAFLKASTGGCVEVDSRRGQEQVRGHGGKAGMGSSFPQGGGNVMGRSGWILDVFRDNMGIMKAIIL